MKILKIKSLLIIILAGLSLIGFSHQTGTDMSGFLPEAIARESKAALTQLQNNKLSSMKSSYPVIGQFKTRDKLIIISAGPKFPLYSLKSSKGQILAIDLPADELKLMFPELKDIIEHGIANWAGLDMRYQEQPHKNAYGIPSYQRSF